MAAESEISVVVAWNEGPLDCSVEVTRGRIASLRLPSGTTGRIEGAAVHISQCRAPRLQITVADANAGLGANPTLIRIRSKERPLAFFLRDVSASTPVYVPEYGIAVTAAGDDRTYAEIAEAVRSFGAVGDAQRIESEPEETCEAAASNNRAQQCPVWLGVPRDMRIFRVSPEEMLGYWGLIAPAYQSVAQSLPETEDKPCTLRFAVGPGSSCRVQISRRLEDGVLPIIRSVQREGDVAYHVTAFATLETQPLAAKAVRGSDWRGAYAKTGGNMYTDEQKEALKEVIEKESHGREEETVCCVRVTALNSGRVPRYAWVKAPKISPAKMHAYDGVRGFSSVGPERVYGVNRLNGAPMPQEEMAVLLPPGQSATFDFLLPHQPISEARAGKLAALDYGQHLRSCRDFWRARLAAGAQFELPEAAIDERVRAGLLHLDMNTIGKEPDGAAMACVGCYAPIGSESAPIIQFFDAMGWHSAAERAVNFFFERQREDGFIQNFGGYQLETGPALWTAGEHWRYTRDDAWVRRIQPKLLRACDYLLKWRERNKTEALRGKGYGLLDGKVADPDDFFRSFMLNGLSYLGLQRAAEMLQNIAPAESKRLAEEAAQFRQDIRTAYYEALAGSPVIPAGDGTWVPAPPPWTGYCGPLALYANGGNWFTHASFLCRDSLIGSLYLVISEVLDASELGASFLLKSHQELMTVENAGLSQPYYCRHDFIHLKRGEVKAYLKTYYNQFTALQDRETYTFWEHYFHASQHKTHEEGWFLMQTRWMLLLEEGNALKLLSAIPRAWLEDGKKISIKNAVTYFGKVSLSVESKLVGNTIAASVECALERRPRHIQIRLPHPNGRKAVAVEGGSYDPKTESVRVEAFSGTARVVLRF